MNLVGTASRSPSSASTVQRATVGPMVTPRVPHPTRVVIRMGLGYHAEDGPAIKARRSKPARCSRHSMSCVVVRAFAALASARRGIHPGKRARECPNGRSNHAVRSVSQGNAQVTLLTMQSPQGPEGLTRSTSPWFLLNSNPKAAKSSTAPVPRQSTTASNPSGHPSAIFHVRCSQRSIPCHFARLASVKATTLTQPASGTALRRGCLDAFVSNPGLEYFNKGRNHARQRRSVQRSAYSSLGNRTWERRAKRRADLHPINCTGHGPHPAAPAFH